MKKLILLLTAILTLLAWSSQGQINFVKDSLIKSTRKNIYIHTTVFQYMDRTNSSDGLPKPSDEFGNQIEYNWEKVNSLEKLNQIALQIFSREEIIDLNDKNCIIVCLVLSSGKIASASFEFLGKDPKIPMKKLVAFSEQIKENITMKLSFWKEVKKDGYLYMSFPAFKNLMKSQKF